MSYSPSQGKTLQAIMDAFSHKRNFDLDKKHEIHYHSWKEHLKMRKLQSLVANCCDMTKI
jgi:hypothetical protein